MAYAHQCPDVDTSSLDPAEEEKEKGKGNLEKVKRDAQEAIHHLHLRTLSLVLTHTEMRKLITNAGTVGHDLVKSSAKAAKTVAPKPEQLARADNPAPHDHFVETEPLADERRERWIWSGKKVCNVARPAILVAQVILECQKHKDYKESTHGRGTRAMLGKVQKRGRESFLLGSSPRILLYVLRWISSIADAADDESLKKWWISIDGHIPKVCLLSSSIRSPSRPQSFIQVGYIPIPRVEYTDDNVDLVVENLTLSGRHLFPNMRDSGIANVVLGG
ncbi:hypothetical protein MVEN_00058000 [Mycena venus]|uniref:HAM1-like N-terminal domain-containing protein n=1 Tax=Mycena venus TaxID=2733690 RepID=A0A8H6Z6R7_9AGAR|nr:hypothetical protein MVEN_00058000 [Mycena venus]